jgi:choice-of-anchor B domain-containing protein
MSTFKVLLIFIMFSISTSWLNGQLNLQFVSNVDYNALHATELNDIWGYEDETGIEYALVGAQKGTSIVSLADPANPVEVFWEQGMESIWRDLKTWDNHAYVTTEAENGLLIIDLNPLPTSNVLTTSYYFGEASSLWSSAHNLYIDENGYAYVFGANRGNGGVIILDVHTDPMNPVEVGVFDNWYVHDGYVRNDTMYLAHISDGFLSMVDVSDKANPILLGTKTTPSNFTHNIWISDNSQYAFTTDEVSGGFLGAYDVTDPTNIIETDRIQSSPGAGVIPHNVHVLGNYLITSYYSDGVTVHDITHPNNMVLVGQYDTYPAQTTSYDGCWGAYPFLNSGLLLATDISEGLFVLQPNYQQAAYLEGVVTDFNSGLPVAGASIQIQGNVQIDPSNTAGNYATGYVDGGTFLVNYSKVGYEPQTHSVELVNGSIALKDVQLVPIPPYNFTVNVVDASNGNPISNADIRLDADLLSHEGITNGIGVEDFVLYYQENYAVLVGKWGYKTSCFEQIIDATTNSLTVELEQGYYDDFEFDFGWNTGGNALTGQWERGVPNGTTSGSQANFDAEFDCGKKAMVTGNDLASHPDADDVDGGTAILISPSMDLTSYADPHVNYQRWFYCMHGAPPNDTMKIFVSNGVNIVEIDRIGPDETTFLQWNTKSIRLSDFLPITASMQMVVRVPDLDPEVNITEGGLDYFFISNSNVLETNAILPIALKVYPNPVTDRLVIDGIKEESNFSLCDINGRVVQSGMLNVGMAELNLINLKSGTYLLSVGTSVFRVLKD